MHTSVIHIVNKPSEIADRILKTEERERPFYILDINDIIQKYNNWKDHMPRVTPFYAVKCNDHPTVLKTLAALGTGFDCASQGEIKKILSIGVDASRIIFAHTMKLPSHISYAASVNIDLTTFDSKCELYKLKKLFPACRALIRIKWDAHQSIRTLGSKFGCDSKTEAPQLLKLAKMLGINVVGVSFHVGTGCRSPNSYYEAISSARQVFDCASVLGMDMKLLNIGGGFPGESDISLAEYAHYINTALEVFFPDKSIQVISEPGTYFVKSSFALFCSVHTIKKVKCKENKPEYMYYINDGIYGSFWGVISLKLTKIPETYKDHSDEQTFISTIWGPSCDSLDKIVSNILLPKLELGEWLMFNNCGAYSLVWSTEFNGFDLPDIYVSVNHQNGNWLSKQKLFVKDTFVLHSL